MSERRPVRFTVRASTEAESSTDLTRFAEAAAAVLRAAQEAERSQQVQEPNEVSLNFPERGVLKDDMVRID